MVTPLPTAPPTEYLHVTVRGIPQPQGSAKAFVVNGRARITSDNPKVKPWRADVASNVADAMLAAGWDEPKAGPIQVTAIFTMPKPASAPKRLRSWPTKRPDLDKLLRGLLDALTASGVWFDDAQVVNVAARKRYAGDPDREGALPFPGVQIVIRPVTE